MDPSLPKLADGLYAWAKANAPRGSVTDVYAWQGTRGPSIALAGDPRRLWSLFGGFETPWRNHQHAIEIRLARELGIEQQVRGHGPSPQFSSGGEMHASEFFEMLEGMVSHALDNDGEAVVTATMIPEPGRPYTGKPTPYYSARTGKVATQGKPPWAVRVLARDENSGRDVATDGADYCVLAPRIDKPGSSAAWMRAGAQTVLVTHSMGSDPTDASLEGVATCKGLLFPSLAVGPVPASNFGASGLIYDPTIVLKALSPGKTKGWPVTLYNTDAWTETTRTFLGDYAAKLYAELTGTGDFLYGPHLYILGPRTDGRGMGHEATAAIGTQAGMLRAAAKRAKAWPRGMTPAQFAKAQQRNAATLEHYGYLEAKASVVLGFGASVAAFCGDVWAAGFAKQIAKLGYKGPVVSVPTDAGMRSAFGPEMHHERDYDRLRFAWAAADAIVASLPGATLG